MGRKKIIDDKTLTDLIYDYYETECGGNADLLKTSAIVDYIRRHGYSEYKNYLLRRNEEAQKVIASLTESSTSSSLAVLVAYKTLDVDAFIQENATRASLRRSLIDLDSYYRLIADKAVLLHKKHKEIVDKLESVENALSEAKTIIDSLSTTNADLVQKNLSLKSLNADLREFIDSHINHDRANLLLEEEHVLQNVNPTIERFDIICAETVIEETKPPVEPAMSFKSGNDNLIRITEEMFRSDE